MQEGNKEDAQGCGGGCDPVGEEWRPFLDGQYEISSHGRLRNPHRGGRILKPSKNQDGYLSYGMRAYGKHQMRLTAHRMVAWTFIGRCPQGHEVNHIDRNKENNCVSNLEYVTKSQNMIHAYPNGNIDRARFTAEQIAQIRQMRGQGKSIGDIAAAFATGKSNVWAITTRRTWRHVA